MRRSSQPVLVHLVHSMPRGRARIAVVKWASKRATIRSCVSYSIAEQWVRPLRVDPLGPAHGEVGPIPTSVPELPALYAMGRPAHVKGLDLFIKALGDGPMPTGTSDIVLGLTEFDSRYAQRLRNLAPEWMNVRTGLNPSILRAGDILVVPSRAETAALLAQEAMARGVVVVATPVGDVPRIIQSGQTGFVAANCSVAAIRTAIEEALALSTSERLRVALRAMSVARERAGAWELEMGNLIEQCLNLR